MFEITNVATATALLVLLQSLLTTGVSAFVATPTNSRFPTPPKSKAGRITKQHDGCGTSGSARCSTTPSTTPTATTAKISEANTVDANEILRRASKAKETWSTIALEPTENRNRHEIDLLDNGSSSKVTILRDPSLLEEFATTVRGTYFINGLSSCQIGDRLVHPFEAHGYCKSFVFGGDGSLEVTSRVVETPLTKVERTKNKVVNRGVMSTVAPMDNLLGNLQNALSSKDRDTANLTADLWPPHKKKKKHSEEKNKDYNTQQISTMDPLLIVTTDNGEPYAVDPETLETKGKLSEVIPKLGDVFKTVGGANSKFVAHTRYDAELSRFVMCINTMVVPGDDFRGNAQMEFLEFDEKFDVVSRRTHTTRFMVFHDWVLTQNYYVVPKNPAYLKWKNIMKFAFGTSLGTEVFAMEEETNGEFILIPRFDPDEEVHEVEADSFFNCFHFGPSFERPKSDRDDKDNDDGSKKKEMVIHGCVFDHYKFGGEMGFDGATQQFDPIAWGAEGGLAPPPQLDRFVIDLDTFEITETKRVPVIPVDMPNFNGDARQLQHSYFLGASRPEGWFPFRQIVKLDLESDESFVYDAGDHQIVSEPMFVPRPKPGDDDDGFVMSIVHNAEEKDTKLTLWDSKTFEEGPFAEVSLDLLFPWCVHGSFHPDYIPSIK